MESTSSSVAAPPPPVVSPSNDFARPPVPPLFAPLSGGWVRRFTFRFFALWLVIFTVSRSLGVVPGLGWVSTQIYLFWRSFVPWFGKAVLQLKEPVSLVGSGSGDKLYDWVQAAAMISFAAVGALGWVWFDRERKADGWVGDLARIAVRYSLGVTMLGYGMAKILYQQMPAPGLAKLLQPYGEASPMGLLWTFMGQSQAYSIFAGALEFIGGLLLFFRRTTMLGAMILFAVMLNVLMMNLCFDVPVKLYSAIYLLMSLWLLAPDARRLWDVIILHRPTVAPPVARVWPRPIRAHRLMTAVKVLLVGWILWLAGAARVWTWAETPKPVKPEYYGLYEVETFTRNDEVLPPLLTDRLRWRRVAIDERGTLWLYAMSDARSAFRIVPTKQTGKLVFEGFERNAKNSRREFAVSRPDATHLKLDGVFNGAKISVLLKRADETKLLLPNRGFHWVSEVPFNR